MKRAVIFFLVLGCVLDANAAESANRKVTLDQARELVLASLTPEQKRLPSLGADSFDDPNSPRFLFFTVTWAGTPNGSVVVGNYAVDPYTGDVFSSTMSCYEEKNRHLEALQKKFRASLNLTQTEYQKLKTKGPLCEE